MAAANEKKQNTAAICEALAAPVAQELNVSLWDVSFEKEGAGWYLRYFIDRENSVDLDTCEIFSRRMSELLDKADPIEQSYCLEVGSPGIGRKLTRAWHFEKYMGSEIELRLIRPVEGVRDFSGTLVGFVPNDAVTIELDEESQMTFTLEETAWVRLLETL